MNNSSIRENVLKQIKERGIEPTARWKFVVKNSALWMIAFISFAAGMLAVSTLIHTTNIIDWDVYKYLGRSYAEHAAIVFPYFWFAVLAIFTTLAYAVMRITKTGYRHTKLAFIVAGMFALIVAGSGLYVLGTGEYIDDTISEYSSFYTQLPHHKINIWSRPEAGLLSGTITRIISNNEFKLEDFSGHNWTIEEGDVRWRRGSSRKIGTKVKLIGLQLNENIFVVNEVRPWVATPLPKVK